MAQPSDSALEDALRRLGEGVKPPSGGEQQTRSDEGDWREYKPSTRTDEGDWREYKPSTPSPTPERIPGDDYASRHPGYVPPEPPEPIAGIQPIQQYGNLPGNPFVGWRADPFNQFLAGAYNTIAPVFAPQLYTPMGQQYNAQIPVNAPMPGTVPQGAPRPVASPPDERAPTTILPRPSSPTIAPQYGEDRYSGGYPPTTTSPTPTRPTEPGAPEPGAPGQKERDFQSKVIRLMQEETLAPDLETAGLRGKGFMFYLMDEGSQIGRIPTIDQMNQFSAADLREMVHDANRKGYFTPDRINQRDIAFKEQTARMERQQREREVLPSQQRPPTQPPIPANWYRAPLPPSSMYDPRYRR